VLAVALVRPGPSAGGMKAEYVARRSGAAPGRWTDCRPRDGAQQEPPLPVYEEDFMRLIAETTGAGLAEADVFRSSLKANAADEASLREKFVFLAATSGRSEAEASRTWETVRRFANYTFCKAHAASFGTLAYATAYLKANHPLEFYAAVLRNHSGMYPVWVHVNEARRLGVRVLPPSINRSAADFEIQGGAVTTGLGSIKHLARATVDATLAARRDGAFQSLADFLARVRSDREETLALVGSGAFDEVEPDRCAALTAFLTARGRLRGPGSPPLGFPDAPRPAGARAFADLEKRRMEYQALGFSPLVHPLEFFDGDHSGPPAGRRQAGRPSGVDRPGVRRSCCGLLAALRHYRDGARGLWFVTLDCPAVLVECVLPDHLPRPRLEIGQAYRVEGLLQTRFGAASLRASAVSGLAERFL